MTVADELATLRAAIAHAERSVRALQAGCGPTLGLRRLASDVRRLAEDLAEVGPLTPRPAVPPPASGEERVLVPEADPDAAHGTEWEGEGVGGLPGGGHTRP